MTAYYVPETVVLELLGELGGRSIFAPSGKQPLAEFDPNDSDRSLSALREPRPPQSPKGFFMPACESVGRYGASGSVATTVAQEQLVLVGVRACELRARNYLDKVMLEGEFDDPAYRQRRENTTVVSCDCVDCAETCCCTLVGGRPFATEGFDANLTPLNGGFVLEVATDKGKELVAGAQLAEVTAEQLAERDRIREKMTDRVASQNAQFSFSADDQAAPPLPNDNSDAWQKFAADCVECGACTHICPTCHCFYLYDQASGADEFERVRTWDSCLLSTYHRMAGGVSMKLSPRPRLLSRLANRVLHKFEYSLQQYGLVGCVGCGRCVDACLGAIDIRQVVQDLSAPAGEASE